MARGLLKPGAMILDERSKPTAFDRLRVIANAVVIPIAIVLNYVGPRETEISATARDEEPLLAAAGWAFSIWALIFAGQLGYAIYQAFPGQHARPLHRRIGWLATANAVLGSLWLFAFTARDFTIAWLIMLGLLAALALVELSMRDDARTGRDYWLVRFPYALNFGWISVATILNTTQWLAVEVGYDGAPLGPLGWTVLLIGAATSIGVAMILVRRNVPFALATAWGLVAIAVYRHEVEAVSISAFVGAALLVVVAVLNEFIRRRGQRTGRVSPGTSYATLAARRRALLSSP